MANNKNEKIIHPEKIHREMARETAGLTCEAHRLKASKKMAGENKSVSPENAAEGGFTSLCVEDVHGEGFENVDVDPEVACP